MNTVITSKEKILSTSRELIQQKGWSAVSIRSVAAASGLSVGSIYNYFDSKVDLMGATVESIWSDIFHTPEELASFKDIEACIAWVYDRMRCGSEKYPGFFSLHSLAFIREEKGYGKQRMQQAWQDILDSFSAVLQHDPKIRLGAFNPQFTEEKFASLLFSLMISALLREDYDPSPILEVTRRTLY